MEYILFVIGSVFIGFWLVFRNELKDKRVAKNKCIWDLEKEG